MKKKLHNRHKYTTRKYTILNKRTRLGNSTKEIKNSYNFYEAGDQAQLKFRISNDDFLNKPPLI